MRVSPLVPGIAETPANDAPGRPQKSSAAFRTISEVADELDVAQHVLRFWESKFPQVRPLKRGGGRRYYRPEDVEILRQIRSLLYDEGYTIKGAQKLLRQRRSGRAASAEEPPATAAPVAAPAAVAIASPPPRPAAAPPPAAPARAMPADARRRLKALRSELRELKELLARARIELG
jgi:DNA-binding transcriptional MerR regulator